MEKETHTKHQSIYYVTAASTLWTRSPFIQRIRYRVRLYWRNSAIPSGKKSAGGRLPKPRRRPRCSDRASLTGNATLGRASRAGCGTRRRTRSAFPPISTLDAFRSCVEEPGGGRGRSAPSGGRRRPRGWRTRSRSAWRRSAAATAPWWTETSSTCGGATW